MLDDIRNFTLLNLLDKLLSFVGVGLESLDDVARNFGRVMNKFIRSKDAVEYIAAEFLLTMNNQNKHEKN